LVIYRNQQGGYNKIMMQMQNLTYTLDKYFTEELVKGDEKT
jgi:hypothetical protein